MGIESGIKQALARQGVVLTSKRLRLYLQEYNMMEMPIGQRAIQVYRKVDDFAEYCKRREKFRQTW